MRFCMVTTFYPPHHFGGDAVYVQALARALVRAGHEVDVVCSDDAFVACGGRVATPTRRGDSDEGVAVHRIATRFPRLASLLAHQTGTPGPGRADLASVLDRGHDVVHYHNVSLVGGPAVLGMGRARAKLMTLHDHWLVCPTHVLWKNRERACDRPTCLTCTVRSRRPPQLWRYGSAIPRALANVDVLLAPSRWSARRHREGGIDRPIEVLPLFSRFEGVAAAPAPGRRFLYVGRLTPSKGVRPLVERFASTPGLELTVVGDGVLRASLAAEFSHAANVRFVWPVDRDTLAGLYAGAVATIVPSIGPESFGLVTVESFAHGTPVIALEAGGCGEIVRDAGAGVVCADLDGVVETARRLDADPAWRAALGARARAAYLGRYNEARHVADYLDLVASSLAHPAPRVPATASSPSGAVQ